jgi:hypothetical protein
MGIASADRARKRKWFEIDVAEGEDVLKNKTEFYRTN